MSDSYVNFVNTKFGGKLTSMLGLPQPQKLERYQVGQPVIDGYVLLGGASADILDRTPEAAKPAAQKALPELQAMLSGMSVSAVAHSMLSEQSSLPAWDGQQKVKALIFDATALTDSTQASELYEFFHSSIRSLLPNGRVIVLGRAPEQCYSPQQATIQRALEGLTRSLAKELRKAVTAQLIYVEHGVDVELESSLRFCLSPKSAYVSAQVIRVAKAPSTSESLDWSKPLAGKKVLVTGASQGIGLAIAEVLARDGAHCICLDIPAAESALSSVVQRLSGSKIVLDLTATGAPNELNDAAFADGGWDAIIHNAGITKDKTLARMPSDWWSNVIDLNLSVQERINHTLVASGGIKLGGRIVCVSSISGIAGNRGQTNYALSKAGVIGMVNSQAPLLAERNITINAVAPGFIETEMTARMPFSVREAGRRLNSLSQGGLPVDVAETVAWLTSPASSGLTGNTIRVCGQNLLGA